MPLNLELKRIVAQKFNNRCIIDFKQYYDVHHILPKSLGGTDDEDNLVPLCFDCHEKIHASGANNWIEYLIELRGKRLNGTT